MAASKSAPLRHDPKRQAGKGQKTRDHILEMARRCMNEKGVGNVNCRCIAKAAGLTPGNIYYYFDNIEAIRAELGKQIGRDVKANLATLTGHVHTASGRRQATIDWLSIVWKWRYFFLDFDQIIRSDERVRADVRASQKATVDIQAKALEDFLKSNGVKLTRRDKELCRDIAVSGWIVSLNWIQHVSLHNDLSQMTREDFIGTVDRYMTVSRTLFNKDFLTKLLHSHST